MLTLEGPHADLATKYLGKRNLSASSPSSLKKLGRAKRIAAGLRTMPTRFKVVRTAHPICIGWDLVTTMRLHPTKGFREVKREIAHAA